MMSEHHATVDILLVEDNPGDVELVREAFSIDGASNILHVAADGVQALRFLRREGEFAGARSPHIVLLDLNLPRKSGREVLQEMKTDPDLRHIPVIVLTSSKSEDDILHAYRLSANCYVTKPVDFDEFLKVVEAIEDFWLTVVKLPNRQ